MNTRTRLTDIYDHLKGAGFDVYFPTQHKGECKSPYVVIRDAGTSQLSDYSTVLTVYELLCYVPKDRYAELQPYKDSVKVAMRGLKPMLIPTRYETAPFFDDTVDAHMTAVQYRNAKYSPM